MPIKRALIVDDSKTAQFRLKKLLQPYQLEVDMAASAEEALGYLSYRQPVVIFMDHHMEGMDGFEALKIIKANPSTAMIPVIMYTSKTDQMYMGQAHELGAIDTISKSYMKASRIEEVLAKLDIVRDKPINPLETVKDLEVENKEELGLTSDQDTKVPAHPKAPPEDRVRIDPSELKAQIARLFEIHIADVRTQMKENTKFILRRVGQDLKEAKKETVSDVPMSVISEEVHAESTRLGLVSNALLVLILVGIAAVSFQHYQSQKQIAQLEENYHYLAELNFEESLLLDKVVNNSQPGAANASASRNESITSRRTFDNGALISALNWAVNTNLLFGYSEAPLGEKNILVLQSLMYKLYNAGFKGFIDINIHFGNFCLSEVEGGGFKLADSATPISECVFADDQKVDLAVDNYTGVPYVQFEQTSPPIQNGDIEFVVNMAGFDSPATAYPQATESLTAGEWNSIAAQNQRLALNIDVNQE